MAAMGRMRRRMAVGSLLQLIAAQASPVLLELRQCSQIMAVAMRALKEAPQFEVCCGVFYDVDGHVPDTAAAGALTTDSGVQRDKLYTGRKGISFHGEFDKLF
jgi:hypothetical protein